MNMLKKGPELKLPDVKVPDFLLDIYYDLRERHLLPLVVILARRDRRGADRAQRLLRLGLDGTDKRRSRSPRPAPPSPSPASWSSPKRRRACATTAAASHGERRRTRSSSSTRARSEGAEASSSSTGENATRVKKAPRSTESTSEPASDGNGEVPRQPSQGNGEPSDGEHLKYYSWAIDVRVVAGLLRRKPSKAEPTVRHNLPELTMLPSRDDAGADLHRRHQGRKAGPDAGLRQGHRPLRRRRLRRRLETCQLLALEHGHPRDRRLRRQDQTHYRDRTAEDRACSPPTS